MSLALELPTESLEPWATLRRYVTIRVRTLDGRVHPRAPEIARTYAVNSYEPWFSETKYLSRPDSSR
jgi:hypothetical protein